MKIEKLAGIDIGSNAIRLLVVNVITDKNTTTPIFKKSAIVRVPIRLGADTFITGKIAKNNINRIQKAMQAFSLLMDVHGVKKYKACATSAMREASNGNEIVDFLFKTTGVKIDVIDGKKEAEIIFSTDLSSIIDEKKSYLYVDVGGGSTEITVFSYGKIINSKSFKIGTVRLLNKNSEQFIWKTMEQWVIKNTYHLKSLSVIGSGGNINKLFKMSEKPLGKTLTLNYLKTQYKFLKNMSYEDRITILGLNPDRADVIIPATKIYISTMQWSGANKIYVPKIGLADGIIKNLYFNKL
jgi:exopolyphosphatase/guanosine-5'-triphosphate,3'-diphosphate pyrophosphatase